MRISKLLTAVLAAGLLLCGCQNAPEPADTTEDTAAETVVEEAGELCLFENGAGLYKFVRPDECSNDVTDTATLGWRLIKDTYGCEVKITTDWVKKNAPIPTDTPEILIGATNRAESAELAASLNATSYRVKCMNNRIVIVGAKDWMLQPAMEALVAALSVDENGRGTVPDNLDLTAHMLMRNLTPPTTACCPKPLPEKHWDSRRKTPLPK